MTNQPPIKVEASPIFLKNLRNLRKKYQRIQEDMQPVIQQLEKANYLAIKYLELVIPSLN